MNKDKILEIFEGAKDENGEISMRLVRQAFEKLPKECADAVSRQASIDVIDAYMDKSIELHCLPTSDGIKKLISILPSAQPQYEEITPEEAASEIASGSMMSARYWLDAMIRLEQMGYVICRKR